MAKEKDKKKKKGKLFSFPMIAVCVLLTFAMKSAFMLFIVGMLPSIVARMTSRSDSRIIFRIVLACNLSGVLPYVAEMLTTDNSFNMLLMMLTSPAVLLVMLGSAAMGHMLAWMSPYMVQFSYEIRNTSRIIRLQAKQKRLLEEWGPEIQRNS